MDSFIYISRCILQFLKTPQCESTLAFKTLPKFKVFTVALIWSYVINFCFSIVFSTLELFGLINFEHHASTKLFEEYPPYIIVLLAVIAAPILEELIFRAPLPLFCKYKKWFPIIFYSIAALFGFVHITNFEITQNVIILTPVLVTPQILIGLFLGLIRLQYGLIYSMLFHALYNGLLILPALTVL